VSCNKGGSQSSGGGGSAAPKKKRVYYYCAGFHGHPYFLDTHLGFRYAKEKFGCEIITVGPQGWDAKAQAEALEQAVAKKPDGIVTVMWDGSGKPAVKRAMDNGIPVIVTEAMVPDHGAMTYIGLDNYACGEDTAKELIRIAGKKGKLVASGNWGASNTDAKFKGLMDYLKANSEWELLGTIDDKANTEAAIEAAKSMFNTYKNIDAIVGLDASSGTGIGKAIEELGLDASKYAIVVHDREDPVLEYIEKGIIDSTVINKTALCAYMSIQLLEAYNDANVGLATVPIARDNKAVGVKPFPEFIYMGTEIITKDNVEEFIGENIPQYR
jgi:ribose transport system substrate-binding protein